MELTQHGFYRFGDGEGATLIGSCEGERQFAIAGGAWETPQFKLTVDERAWTGADRDALVRPRGSIAD